MGGGREIQTAFARWRNRVQHDDQNIAKHATAHGRGALHVRIANVDARLLYLGPIQPVRPQER